jgi:hypothetical protein
MLNGCVQVAILLLVAAPSWRTQAESAARKLAWIQSSKLQRGAQVHFSASELRAFAESRIPVYAPEGVRAPNLELGNGTASASALVDFLKLRHAAGAETNWLIAKIIEGERPVRVTTHIQSANGKATVFMDRVEISGVAVSGAPLDMLVDTFFRPLFPEAKINEPFPLHYGLDHVAITANGLTVYARK